MRLSDAVALGRTLILPCSCTLLNKEQTRGCVLGMAAKGANVEIASLSPKDLCNYNTQAYEGIRNAWPWLNKDELLPCECARGNMETYLSVIIHLFDVHYCDPLRLMSFWSLDRIIDYIRSVEPKEDENTPSGREQPILESLVRLPPLTTPLGERVEAIYGALKSLHMLLERFRPNQAIMCWDSGKPLYRLGIYPGYKAHRKRERDAASETAKKERKAITAQIPILQELLPLLGIKQVSFTNTEGDDLIGSACQLENLGLRIIISGDQDFLQLIRLGIQVWSPNKKILYTHVNFKEHTGLTPKEWHKMRTLSGDTSDNIPPIRRGVGPVTAQEVVLGKKELEWTDEMRKQHKINRKLMNLNETGVSKQLREVVRQEVVKPSRLDLAATKNFFIARAFVSILKEFGTWIQPFRSLNLNLQKEKKTWT